MLHSTVRLGVWQEGNVRLVALLPLQNARQVVLRKRNAMQEVLHMAANATKVALPVRNAMPAVYQKNPKNPKNPKKNR